MKSWPLENYSSLNEFSINDLFCWKNGWLKKKFYVQFNFNIHTPLQINSKAYITLHAQNEKTPPIHPHSCLSIFGLQRWHLDISQFRTINDFISSCKRWHRCNYNKSKTIFEEYGCTTSIIERGWGSLSETVYQLYSNVAQRYGHRIYDLNFFQEIAKRPDYSLLCAWFNGKMIGVFILQEESSTLHSTCCGFDYKHSSACFAYSWMHYVFLQYAIEKQKYQRVDVGLSANEAKKSIGFQPTAVRLDIYSKGFITRGILKLFSRFFRVSLTENEKLKFRWKGRS